jgi:hypothetical protein
MKPYGREKKIKGLIWKRDYHPKGGWHNWWEDMDTILTRSRMKQIINRTVESGRNDTK